MGIWRLGRKSGEPSNVLLVNWVNGTPPPEPELIGMPGTKLPAYCVSANGCCCAYEKSRTQPKWKSLTMRLFMTRVQPRTTLAPFRIWLPHAEVEVPSARPPK